MISLSFAEAGPRAIFQPMREHGLEVGDGREDPPGTGARQAVP